jgi:hypothetical protein
VTADVHYFSPTTPGASSFDVDVSDVVRRGRIGPLSGDAQMGVVGTGNQELDDDDGTLGHDADGILGLKQWYWNETECPAGNRRVYTGYTFDRQYRRADSLVLGPARNIDVTLMDPNAFLSFRVFAPEDVDPTSSFVRPAENTYERIQALLAVDFLSTTLFDIGYIPSTGAKPLDATDYTEKKPADVVNDIAQVLGWNPWVGYDETENKLFLWFDNWRTTGSATIPYDSTIKLTNVESEVASDVLAIGTDAVETVDPSRVVSAVWVNGKGKRVYRTRPTTAYTFGWRDAVMEAEFLSDEAKLNALGDRYLLDNSTEDHKISLSVQVPAALVTAIHEGMRIQLHATHLPSVKDGFGWCRILHRTVFRDQETMEFYWMQLDLTPLPPPLVCSYVPMVLSVSPSSEDIFGNVISTAGSFVPGVDYSANVATSWFPAGLGPDLYGTSAIANWGIVEGVSTDGPKTFGTFYTWDLEPLGSPLICTLLLYSNYQDVFEVAGSDDGVDWTTVMPRGSIGGGGGADTFTAWPIDPPVSYRYWRLSYEITQPAGFFYHHGVDIAGFMLWAAT